MILFIDLNIKNKIRLKNLKPCIKKFTFAKNLSILKTK